MKRKRSAAPGSRLGRWAPLRATEPESGDDIRLLGRLIGDVLREQAGETAFELVERVRQLAVTERRDGNTRSTR